MFLLKFYVLPAIILIIIMFIIVYLKLKSKNKPFSISDIIMYIHDIELDDDETEGFLKYIAIIPVFNILVIIVIIIAVILYKMHDIFYYILKSDFLSKKRF